MHLDDLEVEILRKLELLSEGSTLNLDPNRVHQSRAGSTVPPGVDEEHGESHLRQEVSLAAYHQHRLQRAAQGGDGARLAALAEAEKDYQTAKFRPPSYTSPDSDQNLKDRDEAILRWEGRRPEQVAVFENCSASYVRKIRKRSNRDQTWGGMLDEQTPVGA